MQHCRAEKIYDSPIVQDSFYRLRAIMVPLLNSGDPFMSEVSSTGYVLYSGSFQRGISVEITLSKDDKYAVGEEVPANTEAACKKIEDRFKQWRGKNGPLDVTPMLPAGSDLKA